jgi:ATP-dependent DNA ligase
VKELPEGPARKYELKLDVYRALGFNSGGCARLLSRNGKDFSGRFPSVTRALDALPDQTLIDGDVVAVDERGAPHSTNFDSILVGYHDGRDFKYAESVRAGFTPTSRRAVFARFSKLEAPGCPFSNLPDTSKGRWGAGITVEKMAQCRWLKPQIVVAIDFLEWTLDDRLRHASFVALSTDMPAKNISRGG